MEKASRQREISYGYSQYVPREEYLGPLKEGNNEGQEVREGDPPGLTQDSENPAEGYTKENCLLGRQ